MAKRLTITYSERATHRACGALHGYSYVEGLRPELPAAPLRLGTMLHQALEPGYVAAYRHRSASMGLSAAKEKLLQLQRRAVQDAERNLPGEQMDEVRASVVDAAPWMEHALVEFFGQPFDFDRYELIGAELPLEVPLRDRSGRPGSLWHAGTVDLALYDRLDRTVIIEDAKSTASIEGFERRLQLDDQTTGYLAMLREAMRRGQVEAEPEWLQARFGRVVYNVFRKAAPREPSVNQLKKTHVETPERYERLKAIEQQTGKNMGPVSVAAIDTTPEVYEAALEKQQARGVPLLEKQVAKLQELQSRRPVYYQRVEFHRTEEDLERWRSEAWVEARRIRRAYRHEEERVRNTGHCTRIAAPPCAYQAICVRGLPESTRTGKDVIGFRRVADPHAEEGIRGEARDEEGGSGEGETTAGGAERGPGRSGGAETHYRFF